MCANHETATVGTGVKAGADRASLRHTRPDPEKWIAEHGDTLYRFAMLRLGNPEEAEEVVQECLLAALRAAEAFANNSTERTWLIGILKHKIVDLLRRKSRDLRPERDESKTKSGFFDEKGYWRLMPKRWQEDPCESMQRSEFARVLLGCLRKLPAAMSDAVVLYEMNEMPSADVCEALAITRQNLWQRLHRARLSLRRCLELNWDSSHKTREAD